jgi:homoserine dehydrogenase
MVTKHIGLIGAGTVGFSFAKLLAKNKARIKKEFGVELSLTRVCDKNTSRKKELEALGTEFCDDVKRIVEAKDIDVVVELIGGLHPAKEFIVAALKNGKDVVTANKKLLAYHGKELYRLASENDCFIKFEASVAGAIPLLKPLTENISHGHITELYGILNGTTNFILTNMTQLGLGYDVVLKEAQAKGYAEADPTADVKGHDAMHKVCVLASLAFGVFPDVNNVSCDGIDTITAEDIAYGKESEKTIKLLGVLKRKGNKLEIRVHPAFVPNHHPIAKTDGALNAVFVNTADCGPFLLSGFGAGGDQTAMSVISDVLDIARDATLRVMVPQGKEMPLVDIGKEKAVFYTRFSVLDKPGVLAKIAGKLAEYGISIEEVIQRERASKDKHVSLIIVTHEAVADDLYGAVAEIDKRSFTKHATQVIRIEELKQAA